MPRALAGATKLTELSLGDSPELELSERDVDVLQRLPALRRMYINQTATLAHMLWQLFQALPQLQLVKEPVRMQWERQG